MVRLILLFPLLLPLQTDRTEIKCAGTPELAYAGVLYLPTESSWAFRVHSETSLLLYDAT